MPANPDRWKLLRERLKELARIPLMAFVVFFTGVLAWLLGWTVWRAAEWLFHTYLSRSWLS